MQKSLSKRDTGTGVWRRETAVLWALQSVLILYLLVYQGLRHEGSLAKRRQEKDAVAERSRQTGLKRRKSKGLEP